MEKKFIKISRIVVLASFFALLLLIGAIWSQSEGIIKLPDTIFMGISLLCLIVIFFACICIVIAFFLSVIEGIKTDKLTLLKKFICYFVIVAVILIVTKIIGKTEEWNVGGLLINVIRTIPVFFSVDYIFINKKDNE